MARREGSLLTRVAELEGRINVLLSERETCSHCNGSAKSGSTSGDECRSCGGRASHVGELYKKINSLEEDAEQVPIVAEWHKKEIEDLKAAQTPRPMSEAPEDEWIELVVRGICLSTESEFRLESPPLGWIAPTPVAGEPSEASDD